MRQRGKQVIMLIPIPDVDPCVRSRRSQLDRIFAGIRVFAGLTVSFCGGTFCVAQKTPFALFSHVTGYNKGTSCPPASVYCEIYHNVRTVLRGSLHMYYVD